MRQLLDHHFPASTAQLEPVRVQVRNALMGYGCDHEFVETSVLAVDEAISNVVRHAYAGGEGDVQLRIQVRDGELIFLVRDHAPPFDPGATPPGKPGELRAGGYGRFLMQELMDSVRYAAPDDGTGNLLEMRRRLQPAGHDQ